MVSSELPRTFPVVIKRGFASVQIYRGEVKGRTRFTLSYTSNRVRMRRTFSNYERAHSEAVLQARILSNGEVNGRDQWAATDRIEHTRAKSALLELDEPMAVDLACSRLVEIYRAATGMTFSNIMSAVESAAGKPSNEVVEMGVKEACAALIEDRSANHSPDHVRSLKSHLNRFSESFQCHVNKVRGPDIQFWLDALKKIPLAAKTRRNHLATVSLLFNFAKARGWVDPVSNPVQFCRVEKPQSGRIEIFAQEELMKILEVAPRKMIPPITIGAFCGLRSAEIARLDWDDIKSDHIVVSAEKAKTKARRIVPIPDCLNAWLHPFRKDRGPVNHYRNLATETWRIMTDRGVVWKRNGLRHSYASYRLALINDASKLALEMGNSPTIIFQHYRELVTQNSAEQWFNIFPQEFSKTHPEIFKGDAGGFV